MDFLAGLLIYALAFFGLLAVIGGITTAALLALEERYGRSADGHAFDQAFSATDRLHAEAQRAIRDLEDLANRGDC